VFRTTVTADENTDIDIAVSDLRSRCESNGVAAHAVDALAEQLKSILAPLITNGKVLAAQGSQLSVTRHIGFDGHEVRLIFGAGIPRSGWRKLLDRLFGS
jgi:hypothetical protein